MKKDKIIHDDKVPQFKKTEIKKSSRSLIGYILIFLLLIVAVLYFEFSLGKISYIGVEGNYLLTDKEIILLSKVTENDSFLGLSESQIRENVMKSSEIKDVEIKKVFPNKVIIQVTEYEVVGYLVEDNLLKPLTEDGRIVEDRTIENEPVQSILLYDFEQGDILQELAGELTELLSSIKNSISEIHYTPTELNEFLLNAYTNEGFKIIIPIQNFSQKMLAYPAIANSQKEKGIIDMEVGVTFTPYSKK